MAITTKWYGLGLRYLLETPLNIEGSTVNLALVTSSYTPNRDTDDFRSDFTANEVANGNGYTTGGASLGTPVWSYDVTSQQVRLDFGTDPSWTFTASTSWRYGVVYVDTAGADTTDPLIALLDWGSTQSVSGTYTITIDSTGLLYLDVT